MKLDKTSQPNTVLEKVRKHNRAKNINDLAKSIKNEELLESTFQRRKNKDGEWTKTRTRRQILELPIELALVLEQVYGSEIWKDKALLKRVLSNDEVARRYLTVPFDTI